MKKVSILMPAHNEETIIVKAIESLLQQSYWDIDIIVILDNCTDRTEEYIQRFAGKIKAYKTINNTYKKAGALNQVIDRYFDYLGDYILVMDADTILHHKAIEKGIRFLNKYTCHGAVCSMAGVIKTDKSNLLWELQNIEYGFGDTSFIETAGNVFVCRGMYSLYSKRALRDVLKRGFIYSTDSITEDYELTLQLKKLGYKISSDKDIKAFTDVPITFKEFWIQRVRWLKGGTEDLINHGIKKHTLPDIISSLLYRLLILVQIYFLVEIIRYHSINIFWTLIFLLIYIINIIMRFKYVKNKTLTTYLVAFSIVPLILYGLLDAFLTIYCTFLAVFKIKINWR